MRRSPVVLAPVVFLLACLGFAFCPVLASGSVVQEAQIIFGGGAGQALNVLGGKPTRDGVVSETVIHGKRKKIVNGDEVRIIDLDKELVFTLDMKNETYRVMTFEEFRESLQALTALDGQGAGDVGTQVPEYEVQIDVNPTGERETIRGFECEEIEVLLTAHHEGQTLEEGGGAVMRTLLMMGPKLEVVDEIARFDREYVKKIGLLGGRGQAMAELLQTSPAIQQAMAEFEEHRETLDGTPIRTTLMVHIHPGPSGSKKEGRAAAGEGRLIFISTSEMLSSSASVDADAVAIPAHFKQKKR